MTSHAFATSGNHCPFIPVFGPPQVMFERGLGTQLWDVDGKRYLDFLCGIAVTSLGHSNPVVTAAIAEQAATLMHVSNFFANPVATETAVLVDQLLGGGGQVFFCNSGAEANEAAIKLARKFGGRGRHTVVSALGSFHGRTLAALAATGQPAKHEPFQPMPQGFKHVVFDDIAALDAAVDSVVGYTRYAISGDPTLNLATISIVERGGLALQLSSRVEANTSLMGTKRRVAAEQEVLVARGRKDGRTVIFVPEVKGAETVGITLVHVAFRESMSASTVRQVLQGYDRRYDRLVDWVTESEGAFREDRLAEVAIADLLINPVSESANLWRTGGNQ